VLQTALKNSHLTHLRNITRWLATNLENTSADLNYTFVPSDNNSLKNTADEQLIKVSRAQSQALVLKTLLCK